MAWQSSDPGTLAARRLSWPDCHNVRDLGGLPLGSGGVTRAGLAVRADSLAHLTAEGMAAVREYGVASVIDLRSAGEVSRAPNPFAAGSGSPPAYLHVPLVDDATMEELAAAPSMAERYRLILERRQPAFGDVFRAMAGASGTFAFHCFAGKDRTGLVAALLLANAGAADADIAADFAASDVQLADRYLAWLAEAPADRRERLHDDLICPPERMLWVLGLLRSRWGGAEGYLSAAGVNDATREQLRLRISGS